MEKLIRIITCMVVLVLWLVDLVELSTIRYAENVTTPSVQMKTTTTTETSTGLSGLTTTQSIITIIGTLLGCAISVTGIITAVYKCIKKRKKRNKPSENLEMENLILNIRKNLIKEYQNMKRFKALIGMQIELDVENEKYMMPFDFSTLVRKVEKQTEERFPAQGIQVEYNDIKLDKIEQVVIDLADEKVFNTIQFTGNAGTGKTVAVHKIVWQWVRDCENKQDLGNKYDLVFAIALRDVNVDDSLLEMLSKGKKRLGYIQNIQDRGLDQFLKDKDKASKILLIFDGLDEKTIPIKSDIFKILIGELYKHVKVLFTCRPEANILQQLKEISPMFKVEIHGTTKEGVDKHLSNSLAGVPEAEVDKLIEECKSNMSNFDILKNPFYLTLMGYVLNKTSTKPMSVKQIDFDVPDTVTKLFKIFIDLLKCAWLEKKKAANLPLHCLDSWDIRRKLSAIGKLSFRSLLEEKYEFNEHDLKKYSIFKTDITQSGMFCISREVENITFFQYYHKQIQEFLAAQYLSQKQFEDRSFKDIIDDSKNEKLDIKNVFRKIDRVMPFLFGLDPKFGIQILKELQSNICVVKRNGYINVDYESMLCAEACNQQVTEAMGDLLISADSMNNYHYTSVTPISSVYKLCTGFSTTQHKTLLNKWYKLNLDQEDIDTWGINTHNSESNTELKIENLTEVLYFILCNYIFPNVKSLTVNNSCIFHPGVILRVFPSLTRMEITYASLGSLGSVLDKDVVSVIQQCVTHNTSLTHLTMLNVHDFVDLTLPQCTVSSLLSLSQLSTLTLDCVDILTHIDLTCDIHLPPMHTLKMKVKLTDTRCAGLTHLLTGTPQLTVLELNGFTIITTPQSLLSHLSNLHTLKLDWVEDILTHLDPSCDIHLPKLHTLQMYVGDLTDTMCAGLTHLLTDAPQLTVLELEGPSIISTPQSLLSHLTNLQTLKLHYVDILTHIDPTCDIHLPHLHTLQMYVDDLTDTRCAGLTHLLTGATQLTVLELSCNTTLDHNPTQAVSSLLQQLVNMPELNTLVLYNVIQWRQMPVLCDKLQRMKGLVKLGLQYKLLVLEWRDYIHLGGDSDSDSEVELGREELEQGGDFDSDSEGDHDPVLELSQAVTSTRHITHLYVMYDMDLEKDKAELVVEALRQHFPPHVQVPPHVHVPPHVQVNSHYWTGLQY